MAERSKRRMKQKPSNMFEGVIQGGGGLLGGVWDGVKGVFEKPIQGAEEGGIGGFFSGAGKGILGLFSKPVTGVVDLISNTAEGIKNTIKDEDLDQNRTREIRTFYGTDQQMRNYSVSDARFKNFLVKREAAGCIYMTWDGLIVRNFNNKNDWKNLKCYVAISQKLIVVTQGEKTTVMSPRGLNIQGYEQKGLLLKWTVNGVCFLNFFSWLMFIE